VSRVRLPMLGEQSDHPTEYRLGGDLKLKIKIAPRIMFDTYVPATRAECRDHVGFCTHCRCRFNLARIDGGEDGDRAGRPSVGKARRDATGRIESEVGDLGDQRAGTTLDARTWLTISGELRTDSTGCALDAADRGGMMTEEIAAAIARHRTLVLRILKSALRKLKAAGVDLRDITEPAEPEPSRVTTGRRGPRG